REPEGRFVSDDALYGFCGGWRTAERSVHRARGLVSEPGMHVPDAIGVLGVPADVPGDVEVRAGQRPAEELEARRAASGAERIVDTDDFVLGSGLDVPAAAEKSFAQHAVRAVSRLDGARIRVRAVRVERIEQ